MTPPNTILRQGDGPTPQSNRGIHTGAEVCPQSHTHAKGWAYKDLQSWFTFTQLPVTRNNSHGIISCICAAGHGLQSPVIDSWAQHQHVRRAGQELSLSADKKRRVQRNYFYLSLGVSGGAVQRLSLPTSSPLVSLMAFTWDRHHCAEQNLWTVNFVLSVDSK